MNKKKSVLDTDLTDIHMALKKFKDFNRELKEANDNYEYDLEYHKSKAKVIAFLHGRHSEEYTKLANKLEEISDLEAEIKRLKAEMKDEVKEKISDLFEAEDVIYTRVVETVSVIFTMSKDPKPTRSVAYAKVFDAFTEHLTPELIEMLESLKEQYTSQPRQRPPSLKFTRKDEFLDTNMMMIRNAVANFKRRIINWAKGYDKKLSNVKRILETR